MGVASPALLVLILLPIPAVSILPPRPAGGADLGEDPPSAHSGRQRLTPEAVVAHRGLHRRLPSGALPRMGKPRHPLLLLDNSKRGIRRSRRGEPKSGDKSCLSRNGPGARVAASMGTAARPTASRRRRHGRSQTVTFDRPLDPLLGLDGVNTNGIVSLSVTAESAQWRLRCHRVIAERRAGDPSPWGESAPAVGATSAPNPTANPVRGRWKETL